MYTSPPNPRYNGKILPISVSPVTRDSSIIALYSREGCNRRKRTDEIGGKGTDKIRSLQSPIKTVIKTAARIQRAGSQRQMQKK